MDSQVAPTNRSDGARPFREILEEADRGLEEDIARAAKAARPKAVEAPTQPASAARPIAAILAERSTTHGDFTDNAFIMQRLKEIVHASKNWTTMTDVQREALHMILHKVGRICSGNPDVHDHWDDIAGYAKLVSERI